MWECVLTFANGNTHGIHARSFVGLWNRIFYVVVNCHAPVVGILMARTRIDQIHQGRAVEYVE